jgi:hypothetical protein
MKALECAAGWVLAAVIIAVLVPAVCLYAKVSNAVANWRTVRRCRRYSAKLRASGRGSARR